MSNPVLVHKAVEPDNLSKAGKARFAALLQNPAAIVMPKYDGVYCQIKYVGGKWSAWSRTGEPLLSVGPRILDQFQHFRQATTFIGELWLPGAQHAVINGMARKKSVMPGLGLVLHDALHGAPYAFEDRLAWLRMQAWKLPVYVTSAWGKGSGDLDSLYYLARGYTKLGDAYDGLILRDPNGLFVPGAGKDGEIIKIKPRQSGDFRVLGVVEGKGKASGMAGALILDLGGGVTCEVGTGMDDATRKDYWKWWQYSNNVNWDPRVAPSRIAEIEYLSITKDGKLREPSFKSTRWDKTAADVLPGNIKSGD